MHNNVKTRMKNKEVSFGLVLSLKDPSLLEMAAYAGFDFIRIDCEHELYDNFTLDSMIRTASLLNIPSFIRLATMEDIPRFLDLGATGVMVPGVCSKEDAINAVKMTKYSPLGERGMFGNARFLKYGTLPLKDYTDIANDVVTLIIQIENKEGLSNIDEILAVEGIDMVATGRGDLSQALGFIGEVTHPKVMEAEEYIIKKTLEYGKTPNLLANSPDRVAELVKKGVYTFSIGRDSAIMMQSLKKHLDTFNQVVAR